MNRIESKWIVVPVHQNVQNTIFRFGNNDRDAEIQRNIDEIEADHEAEEIAAQIEEHADEDFKEFDEVLKNYEKNAAEQEKHRKEAERIRYDIAGSSVEKSLL